MQLAFGIWFREFLPLCEGAFAVLVAIHLAAADGVVFPEEADAFNGHSGERIRVARVYGGAGRCAAFLVLLCYMSGRCCL